MYHELINQLKNTDEYQELIAIKKKILTDHTYLDEYQHLLDIQRKLVNAEYLNQKQDMDQYRIEYEQLKQQFLNHFLIVRYIELYDELTETVHQIESILNDRLKCE